MAPRVRRSFLVLAVAVSTAAVRAQQHDDGPQQYGRHLVTTVELGGRAGTTTKALVIRLGDAAVAFDTELLRMSAAWTGGWLSLRGTAYDGAHGPMPRRGGRLLVETVPAPGWALGGDFADPRPIPYGALPHDLARFGGFSLCGDQVVVAYRVGDMAVREAYGLESGAVPPVVVRTLELGASKQEQRMVIVDGPEGGAPVKANGADPRLVVLAAVPRRELVEIDTAADDWNALAMGGPSKSDWLDPSSKSGASISFVPGFARVHGRPKPKKEQVDTAESLQLPLLCDGDAAANDDDTARSVWFDMHKVGSTDTDEGRFLVDLAGSVPVHRIDTFSWHRAERCAQRYDVFGSDAATMPDAAAVDPAAAGWSRIAAVDTRAFDEGVRHGVGIARTDGLGTFRHLLFLVRSGGTFFSEIDVFAARCTSPVDAAKPKARAIAVALRGETGGAGPELVSDGARVLLRVPAHDAPLRVAIALTAGLLETVEPKVASLSSRDAVAALPTAPAKAMWGAPVVTRGERGKDEGPFAVDTITIPFDNPFHSRMRTAAFDFFADGRAAITTWNGDVWVVSGIDDSLAHLEWKRFATGLFDPLGLRIVDDTVFVHGRDGITKLRDSNGDGEADVYECFNNDITITAAFHEFAFDLQTDSDGNFYFSKGAPVNPGGRGFMKIVPHHGTILKLSKDGAKLETIATGLRAPNGIGVSPTGIVTSGDNEGTYMPRCRINWIEKPGFYAGVKDTAHRAQAPDEPDLPLCWMPMEIDNSSGGQVWVTSDKWKDLGGRLLHLSYGTCSVYLVLAEKVDGRMQGGVVRLPADFSSSCMRARFSPKDGQLYVAGFQGWQTSAAREGGFHRVRRTAAPLGIPTALHTCDKGVYLTFDEPLGATTAVDLESYGVEIWNYRYSSAYGSPEISVLHPEREVEQGKPNRDPLPVTAAKLSPDRRTVFLAVDGMRPVQQIKVRWNVDAADGRELKGELHASIHALAKDPGFPTER